jgi:hypothetical protein
MWSQQAFQEQNVGLSEKQNYKAYNEQYEQQNYRYVWSNKLF